MRMWLILTMETEIDWPTTETTVTFEGQQLILRPAEGDSAPDVRVQFDYPEQEHESYEKISRFLTAMAWWNRRPARAVLRIISSVPMRGGRGPVGPPTWTNFYLETGIGLPKDPKARLAMALYREAISIGNTAYEFLGYFKIINVVHNSWKDQVAWINATLNVLTEMEAVKRISELSSVHADVGAYLYGAGRCAVAHAFGTPTVDPDDPTDVFRLSADMPVLRALAEYLIGDHYGVANRFRRIT